MAFQEFNPPASAYLFVASLLPKSYFLAQPPDSGQRLTVIGRDGVATTWDVETGLSPKLVSQLTARGLKVAAHPYEGGPRAAA